MHLQILETPAKAEVQLTTILINHWTLDLMEDSFSAGRCGSVNVQMEGLGHTGRHVEFRLL